MSGRDGVIRAARADDAEILEAIEASADSLLIETLGAWDWPPAGDGVSRLVDPGFVLLIEEDSTHSPVGFVHVLDADGYAHLEQLSVVPTAGRQGHGRALVLAALSEAQGRGYSRVTLRTYAEIPWNAPFYASCGFVESLPESAFHRSLVESEASLGLERYGRRVQMTVDLDAAPGLSGNR
ncbi:GNAT family N-acetyltransferase [Microbacterium sp. NPDC008134]|uniref:GNAT family N-acetyltransferase n=1 Tax=Microbacterium sp. NPDC008134 TaxID=3364183 RepID=UPI0036E163EC